MNKRDELERELEQKLRGLPGVSPDPEFKEDLKRRLQARQIKQITPAADTGRGRRRVVRTGALAATVLLLLAGWLTFFTPGPGPGANPGPLFLTSAQAGLPGITLGSGLDTLREVVFEVRGALPPAEEELVALKYQHGAMTGDEALALARQLGITEPQLAGTEEEMSTTGIAYIPGKEGNLTVWLNHGLWLYTNNQGPANGSSVTGGKLEDVAVNWLKGAGLLPTEEYALTLNREGEATGEVILRPQTAPAGLPLMGAAPELRVTVNSGAVIQATGNWYTGAEEVKVKARDYQAALKALQRGEGVFEAGNFQPFSPGVAVVERVETAYQLAYAIDYTPYLVPVAVFKGSHTPEGGSAGEFTAYVPLVENEARPNSGNFGLDNTSLPRAPAAAPSVKERGNAATAAELPALAAIFGLDGRPDGNGTIRGAAGELSPATWDGGWLYRSANSGQRQGSVYPGAEKVLADTGKLVGRLPLPGTPGTPEIRDNGPGEDKLVIYPLLYQGLPITSLDPPGYASYVSVQVGPGGDVWSVYCSRPMQLSGEEKQVLTPEKAWEQLLANNSLIHVEGFFGMMPGNMFTAVSAVVSGAELAYVPRSPGLMRNEHYDLKYVFSGVARVGEREVQYKAFVDAAL